MNIREQIKKTAEQLLPLYNHKSIDLPDRSLWKHPETDQVKQAQHILLDLLFPGRYTPEPIDFQSYFVQQLEKFTQTLLPEIKKALPFRWIGAAELELKTEPIADTDEEAQQIINKFIATLPKIRIQLVEDVKAAYNGDPAALSYAEV